MMRTAGSRNRKTCRRMRKENISSYQQRNDSDYAENDVGNITTLIAEVYVLDTEPPVIHIQPVADTDR